MEWALHLANVLILCSFLVRDLIFLRLLSIGAGVLFCMYFYKNNMMEPIVWNILFSIVNTFQIALHSYQSRKIPLNHVEQFLYDKFFPTLNPIEIRSLYQKADTNHVDADQNLELQGLGLIISGSLKVKKQKLNTGNFLGIHCFLSRQDHSIIATSHESLSYLCWQESSLRQWASHSTERYNLLLKALSTDLLHQTQHQLT
jgi:hypothetical protein